MLVDTMLNKVRTITQLNFVNTHKVNTLLSMETGSQVEVLKLLIVGNNPIELSKILDKIEMIDRPKDVKIAFDFHSILDRLHNFKPDFILIDDNIGRPELRHVVDSLLADRHTKNIPITVLKNSNYHEAISTGVMDFILKENLSPELIYKALRNNLKIRKTQLYLYNSYKKRKGQLMRLFRASEPAFQI